MRKIANIFFVAIIVLIVVLYLKTNHGNESHRVRKPKISIRAEFDTDWLTEKASKKQIKTVIPSSDYISEVKADSIFLKYKLQSDLDFDKRLRLQITDNEGRTVQDYVFLLDSASKSINEVYGEYYLTKCIPNENGTINIELNVELLE